MLLALLCSFNAYAADYDRPPEFSSPSGITIIHAGTLLAVPGTEPMVEQSIFVEAGKIVEIRPGYVAGDSIETEAAIQIVNLADQFVMPGFLDLHVHLSTQSGSASKLQRVTYTDADYALNAAMYARRTLLAGFTTVRDVGSRGHAIFALRDAVNAGKVPGPKILASGSSISATGGHGDVHGFRQEVLDALPDTGTCDGPDSCRAAVRRQVKRGADVIKVTATGGVLSETATGIGQQLTDEELRAIVETAHSLGRKATAHAHAKEGIDAALRAGFDSIEHSTWADEETMALFKQTGAWMIPTVSVITAVGDTPEKMMQGPLKDMPPPIMAKLLAMGSQPKDMVALAYRMGVNIALGTDAAVSPHGENATEFVDYVAIGMSEMESLAAGTINAAIAAGLDDTVGSLEPGKAADIVAMSASPLTDIRAVLDVAFVMRDGIIFKQ